MSTRFMYNTYTDSSLDKLDLLHTDEDPYIQAQ